MNGKIAKIIRHKLFLMQALGLPAASEAFGKPCPPPQISVSGGNSATTSCAVAPGANYPTNFPATENPLSEGGR